ncbi:hypothetical protein V5F41_12455 [Xanthobacter autotrophicus]|uniref:hypothetical protein n=1 Tax=Xanthobacter autotrophicus TaxID=280 RepID=UPI0037267CD4
MTDHNRQPPGFRLQPLTPRQVERVFGGTANIVADMVLAYVEAAGPQCGERLLQLRAGLIQGVRNRGPVGLALEEEAAVVETLVTLIEVGFSCIEYTPAPDDEAPDNA